MQCGSWFYVVFSFFLHLRKIKPHIYAEEVACSRLQLSSNGNMKKEGQQTGSQSRGAETDALINHSAVATMMISMDSSEATGCFVAPSPPHPPLHLCPPVVTHSIYGRLHVKAVVVIQMYHMGSTASLSRVCLDAGWDKRCRGDPEAVRQRRPQAKIHKKSNTFVEHDSYLYLKC